MVTVYLPMSSFPWGGLILLFAIAMVTLMASSALANYPYKFLRYNNNISHQHWLHIINRKGLLYRDSKPATIDNLQLTLWQAAVSISLFVTLVVAFLVLLYFFYTVVSEYDHSSCSHNHASCLVYVAIAIYCLLCTRSVYSFLSPFVALVSFTSQWRLVYISIATP